MTNPSLTQLTIANLVDRISKGYAWLTTHSQAKAVKYGFNYNPVAYSKALKTYEGLVDQASKIGYTEKACWNPQTNVCDWSEEQVKLWGLVGKHKLPIVNRFVIPDNKVSK